MPALDYHRRAPLMSIGGDGRWHLRGRCATVQHHHYQQHQRHQHHPLSSSTCCHFLVRALGVKCHIGAVTREFSSLVKLA
ncbi:unnamed protein product [Lota lota]